MAPTGLALTSTPAGIGFAVRVMPRARRNAIIGLHGGALKVTVTAPPEGGRATEMALETIAAALGVKRNQVSLLAGATSRQKLVLVSGLTAVALTSRLAAILPKPAAV